MFKNDNKGIVFKARLFVGPDKTRAWPLFLREMIRAMPSSFHLNNGCARVLSGCTNHLALKTVPLFSNYNLIIKAHAITHNSHSDIFVFSVTLVSLMEGGGGEGFRGGTYTQRCHHIRDEKKNPQKGVSFTHTTDHNIVCFWKF